jgi:excisionase family DNA binding protein
MQLQDKSINLLNKQETAERLNISQRTLDNRIKAGTIPYLKLGKLIRFLPSDIEQFIQSLKIGG